MEKLTSIGNLLKKIYRNYSNRLISKLEKLGHTDLRPSFLEILTYLSQNDGSPIKMIGKACGLKKQTMTGHINELKKRGYITTTTSDRDKREQLVYLSEYGNKFKFSLREASTDLEQEYSEEIGAVELDRLLNILEIFYEKQLKLSNDDGQRPLIPLD